MCQWMHDCQSGPCTVAMSTCNGSPEGILSSWGHGIAPSPNDTLWNVLQASQMDRPGFPWSFGWLMCQLETRAGCCQVQSRASTPSLTGMSHIHSVAWDAVAALICVH